MLDGAQDDNEKRRKRKVKKRHRKDKDSKNTLRKNKSDGRKSISSSSKRKLTLSKKLGIRILGKRKDLKHIRETIQMWKLRWKNRAWRLKWKQLWGKSKWKANIRKRWNADKRWRRKWMKKILKKWWDKKWRRKWMKRWIDNRWLNRWNRRRLRRRRLWKKRWGKSGAKKMGLSFNEFLLTERRLRALQKIHPGVVNRRRKEKRMLKEKIIREKQERQERFNEELSKMCFLKRFCHSLIYSEYYGPETFGIRPAVIQFKFYIMNMLQGLLAFLLVLYFHLTHQYIIPNEYILHGLYGLVYFATAMDFYGSIFGMVTSYHLESYYGRKVVPSRKKKAKKNRFLCCRRNKIPNENDKLPEKGDNESSMAMRTASASTTLDAGSDISKVSKGKTKRQSKISKKRKHSNGGSLKGSMSGGRTSNFRLKKRQDDHADKGKSRKHKANELTFSSQNEYFDPNKTPATSSKVKSFTKVECKCRGLGFLYCAVIRKCFRPGRSREFINRMGYSSWILLQLAWYLNIVFTAYYNWLKLYSKDYQKAAAQCKISPRMKHCDDFEQLYIFLLTIVGTTFTLRNIFVFIIGMCFSERYLKRCRPIDPNDEMASTCSDTDIDYSKVPRQILVPHLLSGGKYPYVIPGPCRPIDYMLGKVTKVTDRNSKQSRKFGKQRSKRKKKSRRILTTHDKEAAKVLAGFKQIRRAHDPLIKGRRKPMRIPVAVGVTDTHQLPPELMTTKAYAWLYDENNSSDTDPVSALSIARHRRPVKWRSRRKRNVKPLDSAILTVIHDSKSLSKVPIEDIIKPKLENLSERDSTDQSWSMKTSSLFEPVSGVSSDDDLENDDSNEYMQLMKLAGDKPEVP